MYDGMPNGDVPAGSPAVEDVAAPDSSRAATVAAKSSGDAHDGVAGVVGTRKRVPPLFRSAPVAERVS
jgi:hypothetical protein